MSLLLLFRATKPVKTRSVTWGITGRISSDPITSVTWKTGFDLVTKTQVATWSVSSTAVTKYNSFEGGTAGVAISAGNSGGVSGNAFTYVNTSGVATLKYDTNAAHGSRGAKIALITTDNYMWQQWDWTPNSTFGYARAYVYTPTVPNPVGILFMRTGSYSIQIGVDTSSHFFTTTGNVHGTYTYLANTWYRVEVQFKFAGAGVGYAVIKIFVGDSTTAVDTITSGFVDATNPAQIVFGAAAYNNASTTQDFYLDDVAFSDTNWLGPVLSDVKSQATTWQVLPLTATVATTQAITWATSATVAKTQAITWLARVVVSTTQNTSWIARSFVFQAFNAGWQTRAAVITPYDIAWSTHSLILQTFNITWLISAGLDLRIKRNDNTFASRLDTEIKIRTVYGWLSLSDPEQADVRIKMSDDSWRSLT